MNSKEEYYTTPEERMYYILWGLPFVVCSCDQAKMLQKRCLFCGTYEHLPTGVSSNFIEKKDWMYGVSPLQESFETWKIREDFFKKEKEDRTEFNIIYDCDWREENE